MRHGTAYAYKRLKCRCEVCRAHMRPRWRAYHKASRANRGPDFWRRARERERANARTRAAPPERHGTIYCYRQGCRCEGCVTAARRVWLRSYYIQSVKPGARRRRRLKRLRYEARRPELIEAKLAFFASRPRRLRLWD